MSTNVRILKLSKSGLPQAWVSREEAATLYVKERVLWTLGTDPLQIFGAGNLSAQVTMRIEN